MAGAAGRSWRFWLLALLCLPAGLVLLTAVRFGGATDPFRWRALPMAAASLIPAWTAAFWLGRRR